MTYKELNIISINGKNFNKNTIDDLKSVDLDVHSFLTKWFNDESYLTVSTSGSTGKPKNIEIEKNKMIASAKSTCDFLGLTYETQALLCLPAKYIGGMMMLVRAMVRKFNLEITPPTKTPFENIENGISFTAMTPYQMEHSLINQPEKIKAVDTIILGGAPISTTLKEAIKKLPNQVFETFGMTETLSHIGLKEIKKSDLFEVVPPSTISVEENQQLIIHAPHLGIDSLKTNDVIDYHSSTLFKWLGRADFVINSGGIKIHPEQLEEEISSLTGLNKDTFFISSLPHETLGEQVVLFSKLPVNEDLLDSLPKYHKPKETYIINDFVYTENGKLNRIETKKKARNAFQHN